MAQIEEETLIPQTDEQDLNQPNLLAPYLQGDRGQAFLMRERARGHGLNKTLEVLLRGDPDTGEVGVVPALQAGVDPVALLQGLGATREFVMTLPNLVNHPEQQSLTLMGDPLDFSTRVSQFVPGAHFAMGGTTPETEFDPAFEQSMREAVEREDLVEDPTLGGPFAEGFFRGAFGKTKDHKTTSGAVGQVAGQTATGIFLFGRAMKFLTGTETVVGALKTAGIGRSALAGGGIESVQALAEKATTERKGGVTMAEVVLRGAFGAGLPLVGKAIHKGVAKGLQLHFRGKFGLKEAEEIMARVSSGHLASEDEFLTVLRSELAQRGNKISKDELRKIPAVAKFLRQAQARSGQVGSRRVKGLGPEVAQAEASLSDMRAIFEYEKDAILNDLVKVRTPIEKAAALLDVTSKHKKNIQLAEAELKSLRMAAKRAQSASPVAENQALFGSLRSAPEETVMGIGRESLPPMFALSENVVDKAGTRELRRLLAAAKGRGVPVDDIEDMSRLLYGRNLGELSKAEMVQLTSRVDAEGRLLQLFGNESIHPDFDPTAGVTTAGLTRNFVSRHVMASIDKQLRRLGPMGVQVADRLKNARFMTNIQFGTLWTEAKNIMDSLNDKQIAHLVQVMEARIDDEALTKAGVQDIPGLRFAASKLQGLMDVVWTQWQRLHPDTGYIRSYFPHIAKDRTIFTDPGKRIAMISRIANDRNIPIAEAEAAFERFARGHGAKEFQNLTRSRSTDPENMIPFLGDDGNRKDIYSAIQTYLYRGSETNQLELAFGAAKVTKEGGTVKMGQMPVLMQFEKAVGANFGDESAKLWVSSMMARAMETDLDTVLGNRFLKGLRNMQVVTKLGTMQTMQIGQAALTAGDTSLAAMYKGMASKFGLTQALSGLSRKELAEFVGRSGVLKATLKEYIAQSTGATGRAATRFLRYSGGTMMDDLQRNVAGRAALVHLDEVAAGLRKNPGNTKLVRELQRFGLDTKRIVEISKGQPYTELERLRAMNVVSGQTQFGTHPEDLPPFFTSKYGRVLTQFKTFPFQYARFMKDRIWGEAKRGNLRPLMRFFVAAQIHGEVVNDIKLFLRDPEGVATGQRTRGDEPTRKVSETVTQLTGVSKLEKEIRTVVAGGGRLTDTQVGRWLAEQVESGRWSLVDRMMDNFLAVGGFGLYTDILSGISFREDPRVGFLEFVGGPSSSDITELIGLASNTIFNPGKVGRLEFFIKNVIHGAARRMPLPARETVREGLLGLTNIPSRRPPGPTPTTIPPLFEP